jgi:hypothetical protein
MARQLLQSWRDPGMAFHSPIIFPGIQTPSTVFKLMIAFPPAAGLTEKKYFIQKLPSAVFE